MFFLIREIYLKKYRWERRIAGARDLLIRGCDRPFNTVNNNRFINIFGDGTKSYSKV